MIRQLFFGISIAFSIGLLQWVTKGPQSSINPNGNSRLEKIKGIYDNGLLQLHQAIQTYEDRAADFQLGKSDLQPLQQAHLNTRLAFKKVEFLLEYYDREAVVFYLNGAPLPSLEQNIAENNVIEPEGLQVLDEPFFQIALGDASGFPGYIEMLCDAQSVNDPFRRYCAMLHDRVHRYVRVPDHEVFAVELVRLHFSGLPVAPGVE